MFFGPPVLESSVSLDWQDATVPGGCTAGLPPGVSSYASLMTAPPGAI